MPRAQASVLTMSGTMRVRNSPRLRPVCHWRAPYNWQQDLPMNSLNHQVWAHFFWTFVGSKCFALAWTLVFFTILPLETFYGVLINWQSKSARPEKLATCDCRSFRHDFPMIFWVPGTTTSRQVWRWSGCRWWWWSGSSQNLSITRNGKKQYFLAWDHENEEWDEHHHQPDPIARLLLAGQLRHCPQGVGTRSQIAGWCRAWECVFQNVSTLRWESLRWKDHSHQKTAEFVHNVLQTLLLTVAQKAKCQSHKFQISDQCKANKDVPISTLLALVHLGGLIILWRRVLWWNS